jgi:hypothetical protein
MLPGMVRTLHQAVNCSGPAKRCCGKQVPELIVVCHELLILELSHAMVKSWFAQWKVLAWQRCMPGPFDP